MASENQENEKETKIIIKRKPRWMTRAMAEEFSREDLLSTTFIETIFHTLFMVFITVGIVGRHKIGLYYLTRVLLIQISEVPFQSVNEIIDLSKITTASRLWEYLEDPLMNALYHEYYYSSSMQIKELEEKDRLVLFENKLMGVPRIRQVRVRNDSCVIHKKFRSLFQNCYAVYSYFDKDRKPFGLGTATAWIYTSSRKTRSRRYSGKISRYAGGGYYQDLGATRSESLAIIQHLKNNLWIDPGTSVVFVDFLFYNPNLNLFAHCKLIFEFPPSGGVIPSAYIYTFNLLNVVTTWDYFAITCEVISFIMVIYIMIQTFRELVYFKWRFFLQFWDLVDTFICFSASLAMGVTVLYMPTLETQLRRLSTDTNTYINFESVAFMRRLFTDSTATTVFLVYIKVFKYLNFNKTMGQLNTTLRRCAKDILGFSIMFFIIFFAFSEFGYLIFGTKIEEFSTIAGAMFTLLRTILGDFNYSAAQAANRNLAPLYFVSYIIIVFFVLLNMFLAIINDTYANVKTEIAIAPEEMQMTEYLKRKFFETMQKWGCRVCKWKPPPKIFTLTIREIRDALKKCGFGDLEIEMFFARYNIDSRANVDERNIRKLIAELEKYSKENSMEEIKNDTGFVQLNDFISQHERLDHIETNIKILNKKIGILTMKIENLIKRRSVGSR